MKLIKMSYKGLSFNVNPSSVEISLSKNISVKNIPFVSSNSQEINIKPSKISGKGKFIGEDSMEKAYQLERIFKSKGSSYLFVPNSEPIKVFFSSLSISFDSKDNSVNYSFEFVEDISSKKDEYPFGFTYIKKGENLYDISNRTGISVDKLIEINDCKDLFTFMVGDKIWLS